MQIRIASRFGALVVVSCILGSGCHGPSPDARPSEATESDTVVSDTGDADSIAHDASSDTTEADERLPPDPPPPAPAPGSVEIRGTVTRCDSTGSGLRCRIEVNSVLAYGSATPPIDTGEQTVTVAPGILDGQPADSLAALGERVLVVKHGGPRPDIQENGDDENRLEWSIHEIREP